MKLFKKCTKCNKELPYTSEYFYIDRRSYDGLYSSCKDCHCKTASKSHKVWRSTPNGILSKKLRDKRYTSSPKGKAAKRRHKAKRRNYGYIELYQNPFDKSEEVEWHHINDAYVVALPKDLHRLYHSRYGYHKEMCMEIIKQVYNYGKDIWNNTN